jgi:hypothetical protein
VQPCERAAEAAAESADNAGACGGGDEKPDTRAVDGGGDGRHERSLQSKRGRQRTLDTLRERENGLVVQPLFESIERLEETVKGLEEKLRELTVRDRMVKLLLTIPGCGGMERHEALKKNKGPGKSIIATARKVAVIIWHILSHWEAFDAAQMEKSWIKAVCWLTFYRSMLAESIMNSKRAAVLALLRAGAP